MERSINVLERGGRGQERGTWSTRVLTGGIYRGFTSLLGLISESRLLPCAEVGRGLAAVEVPPVGAGLAAGAVGQDQGSAGAGQGDGQGVVPGPGGTGHSL